MVLSVLQNIESRKTTELQTDKEKVIRNVLGTAILGGADTTVISLEIFMLAMVCNQDILKKAEDEIDRALFKETLRWQPLLPLAIPHRLMEDDICGEYFIPKGTLVFANSWFICHDESLFGPDTNSFQPERFFRPDVQYPTMYLVTEGGYRICPGRHMADETLFIGIASIL
ncbi:hypothetical protein M422DRAFT_256886 [Sphaerobolus stellatus SS14]|uniref:Cytochrome P450 n=1 Tax=Sphaerobolus stellatus (strain SS14) TaxID=990650 RepID=A0A0C9UZQ4_SPHS4|nr:hypothetical protein M422DRAFT_256886 [Sphaerobolus stellatus SS14]